MTCADVRAWLQRDLDGAAEPSADAAAHLERCDACRVEAGRLKSLAETARAALPRADVPPDFTEQVMAALVEPHADRALARAARGRGRRWLPLLLVPLLAPLLLLLPPRALPMAEGELVVEREGRWVDAGSAADGEVFGVADGGRARDGAVRITALGKALLRAGREPELLAGRVLLEASRYGIVRTPLAEIRLEDGAACVAQVETNTEEPMEFRTMKLAAPAVLAVTVLAGGIVVANDEGEEEAREGGRIRAEAGKAPTLEQLQREMNEVHDILREVRVRLDELQRALGEQAPRDVVALRVVEALDRLEPRRVPPPGPWGDAVRRRLEKPMTLRCEEAPLAGLLDIIAKRGEVRVECIGKAQDVVRDARITVHVTDVPAASLLERALATHDLVCRIAGSNLQILRREDVTGPAWPERREDGLDLLLKRARSGDDAARQRLAEEREELRRRLEAIEKALLPGEMQDYEKRRQAIADAERMRERAAQAELRQEVQELRRRVEEASAARERELLRDQIADALAFVDALEREGRIPSEELRERLAGLRLRAYEELSRVRNRAERGLDGRAVVDEWEAAFARLAGILKPFEEQAGRGPDGGR